MRGQISIEFNWIFVLIVGAVILGFFIMFIQAQNKGATAEEANELIQSLDTVLTTIINEPDASQTFSIPQAEIDFTCEPELSQYFIQGTGPVVTTYDIIFTQQKLRGKEIAVWTKLWRTPYETATFTYMANERTLFVFVNTTRPISGSLVPSVDAFTHQLYRELPDTFKKTEIYAGDLETFSASVSGYDAYIFITTVSSAQGLARQIKQEFSSPEKSYLRGVSKETSSIGTVAFATPSAQEPKSTTYFGQELMWGALFSEDYAFYECTRSKALQRFEIITRILEDRSQQIQREMTLSVCSSFFTSFSSELNQQIILAKDYDADAMAVNQEDIKKIQQRLLRDVSCPYLY